MKQSEYPEWEMQPRLLNKEEVTDPGIVLDEVFDYAHLPEWRSLLWEWLKITVSGTYNTESAEYDRSSILYMYEKLQKGGYLIVDDYGWWKGAKLAFDDFFKNNKHNLHFVDHTSRFFIKD